MGQSKKIAPINEEDRDFLEEFLAKYRKFIIYIANQYARPEIQADDIGQEAILRLMQHIPKLRTLNHNAACSYIAHTVQTAFLDLERKEKRHSHVSMDSILEEIVGTERDLVPDLFLRQEVQRLRKGLKAREWMALKGKYMCGYSQEELGKQLDIAPDSVRMVLSRARKQSQQILSPEKVTGGGGND